MDSELLKRFTKEEVEKALNQMAPLKYLGLDHFGTIFLPKTMENSGQRVM